jgi:hypothetical protein
MSYSNVTVTLFSFVLTACAARQVPPECPFGTYPAEFHGGGKEKAGGNVDIDPKDPKIKGAGSYEGEAWSGWRCMTLCPPNTITEIEIYQKGDDIKRMLRCLPNKAPADARSQAP